MTLIDAPKLMTTEELEALPDDGRERWLIDGGLREREMTKRNRGHCRIGTRFAAKLQAWLDLQPAPRGEVLPGEIGVRLRRDPDTTVGIDVAYISADTVAANPRDDRIIEGVPLLVIEVLSPSDKQEDIDEKVSTYLECGVPLVWVSNVKFRMVIAYRPGIKPKLYSAGDMLSADPHLPGFSVPVDYVFGS